MWWRRQSKTSRTSPPGLWSGLWTCPSLTIPHSALPSMSVTSLGEYKYLLVSIAELALKIQVAWAVECCSEYTVHIILCVLKLVNMNLSCWITLCTLRGAGGGVKFSLQTTTTRLQPTEHQWYCIFLYNNSVTVISHQAGNVYTPIIKCSWIRKKTYPGLLPPVQPNRRTGKQQRLVVLCAGYSQYSVPRKTWKWLQQT